MRALKTSRIRGNACVITTRLSSTLYLGTVQCTVLGRTKMQLGVSFSLLLVLLLLVYFVIIAIIKKI